MQNNYSNFYIAQILTDRHLRVLGDPSGNSYAIGDCADIKDYSLPCTAQVGFQVVRRFQIKLLYVLDYFVMNFIFLHTR